MFLQIQIVLQPVMGAPPPLSCVPLSCSLSTLQLPGVSSSQVCPVECEWSHQFKSPGEEGLTLSQTTAAAAAAAAIVLLCLTCFFFCSFVLRLEVTGGPIFVAFVSQFSFSWVRQFRRVLRVRRPTVWLAQGFLLLCLFWPALQFLLVLVVYFPLFGCYNKNLVLLIPRVGVLFFMLPATDRSQCFGLVDVTVTDVAIHDSQGNKNKYVAPRAPLLLSCVTDKHVLFQWT